VSDTRQRWSWVQDVRRFSTADWIVAGTATFIMVDSLLICIGWWSHIRTLVQLNPTDAPTHINTAVGFFLMGFGELALLVRRRIVATAAAGVLIFLSCVELAEYAFGLNTGIDTLLAVPFIGLDALHPGRMPGNTLACFLLIGGAQVVLAKSGGGSNAAVTAAIIMKSLAGGIAFIALLGYVAQLKSAYGWTDSVGMSITSWAGVLLVLSARIATLWQRDIVEKPGLPSWFLPFLATAVTSISIGLVWTLHSLIAAAFMTDTTYSERVHRMSLEITLSVGTLIVLGTISVLVAKHKAMLALQQAAQLRLQVLKRSQVERELQVNNQHLARSNRDLEDFAYVASHDLKSPLSGINSAAKWLEEDLHDTLSGESKTILGLMRSRINRMEKLLDDLLTYSRAGRTDAAIGETNVAEIFASIIEVLGPPAHIKVRVEGQLPVIVTASAQLEQVLRNLVNNAIKHHDKPAGEVVLSVQHVGDFVEFIVRDDGPGILPQFHEKIFQLFQTLKRRDEVEGSGMGLAVVKKLVEQQNSRITVHSQGNGSGSEFRFQWPTTPPHYDAMETMSA
jgi:signal transduction histidine kinase